jgi:hypothetical protein
MSGKSRKSNGEMVRAGQYVPLRFETLRSPAYKQLSFGARALFTALRMRVVKNNGRVYLSQRDAEEELGRGSRNDIANWFRELVHYGFIVQTAGASLGVDGKGKATRWRITDLPARDNKHSLVAATDDFAHWNGEVFVPHIAPSRRWNGRKSTALKKQNPGLHVESGADCTCKPLVDRTLSPLNGEVDSNVQPIRLHQGGLQRAARS